MNEPVSKNITPMPERKLKVNYNVYHQQPMTVWLTGLSGSGKSTIAAAFEQALISRGIVCALLDGDNLRHGLNRDLGFSPEDRAENIRRVAEVAKLMNDIGIVVITSFISPYRADRIAAMNVIGDENYREVFISAPLSVCESRDPKGLYKKARAGELPGFTGIDAPYEAPNHPALIINTNGTTVDYAVDSLIALR